MSTHGVPVVRVKLESHENADALSLVHVKGWQVVVRTADWNDGDLGAYIAPDYVVPDTEQFAFLDGHLRIRARKFRGERSFGLLVPAPKGAQEGDDVMEQMGVIRYVPPAETRGISAPGPPGLWLPKYDLEPLQSYPEALQVGEYVVVTEKIHGANARYVFHEGQFYCGSRTQWKLDTETDLWWRALRCHPGLMEYLQEFPGRVVYGEVFGNVQDLKYGLAGRGDHYHFAAFDLLERDKWLSPWQVESLMSDWNVPTVPVVAGASILSSEGNLLKYESVDQMVELADGNSLWPGCEDQIREGIVISPLNVRHDPEIGYVKVKVVSHAYLERGGRKRK